VRVWLGRFEDLVRLTVLTDNIQTGPDPTPLQARAYELLELLPVAGN
jgi:hypothetical protein